MNNISTEPCVRMGEIVVYCDALKETVFGQIGFVAQVAHDRDTYATSNISP